MPYTTDKMYIAGYINGAKKIRPDKYGLDSNGEFFATFPITPEDGQKFEMDFMVSESKGYDDSVQHFKRTCFGNRKKG